MDFEDMIFDIFAEDIDLVVADFRETLVVPMINLNGNNPEKLIDFMMKNDHVLQNLIKSIKKISGIWEGLDDQTEKLIDHLLKTVDTKLKIKEYLENTTVFTEEQKAMIAPNAVYLLLITEMTWQVLIKTLKFRKNTETTSQSIREEVMIIFRTVITLYKVQNRIQKEIFNQV